MPSHRPHDDTDPIGIGHLDTGPLPAVQVAAARRRGPDWAVVLTAGLAVGLAGGLISAAAAMGYAHPLTIFRRHVVASDVPGPVRTVWRTRTVEYGPVPDPVTMPVPTVTVTVAKAAPGRTVTRTVTAPGAVRTVTASPGPDVTVTTTVTATVTDTDFVTETAAAPVPDTPPSS